SDSWETFLILYGAEHARQRTAPGGWWVLPPALRDSFQKPFQRRLPFLGRVVDAGGDLPADLLHGAGAEQRLRACGSAAVAPPVAGAGDWAFQTTRAVRVHAFSPLAADHCGRDGSPGQVHHKGSGFRESTHWPLGNESAASTVTGYTGFNGS